MSLQSGAKSAINQAGMAAPRRRAQPRRPAGFRNQARVVASLVVLIMLGAAPRPAAAGECTGHPNLQPGDAHWYYRIDRLNHQRCWYQRGRSQSEGSSTTESEPAVANAKSVTSSLASFFAAWKGYVSPPQPDAAFAAQTPEPGADSAPQKSISPRHHHRWASNESRASKVESHQVHYEHAVPSRPQDSTQHDELFEEFLRWSMRPE